MTVHAMSQGKVRGTRFFAMNSEYEKLTRTMLIGYTMQ
jgi:hypothetical protein